MAEERQHRTTHVVAVANQKGGVGKTTNTINLAAALGELGKESLIVDLDMTAGATKALGAPTSGWTSTFELLTHAETAEECIIDDRDEEVRLPPHIDLIPSSRRLAELDAWLALPDNRWVQPLDLLLEPIERLRGRYDFIFLDTPPQVTKTSLPAFKAADYVILSATPDTLAIEGLADALKDIASARKVGNPKLRLLGVILCAIPKPKTRLSQQLIKYVDTHIADASGASLKFETEVVRTVVLQEAQAKKTTVFGYQASHPVAEQYRALAREVVSRLDELREVVLEPAAALSSQPGGVAANA
jgi:chromosome partitioning protein